MKLAIRTMTLADLPLGLRLREEAGWNQLEADWRRFLELSPEGCFVAEVDGRGVGTVTTCTFGDVAWIGMMLVEASQRGRGIGTALMKHALAWLDHQRITSVRLDATPMGRPLYEKLGFQAQFELARFAGQPTKKTEVDSPAVLTLDDLDAVVALDRRIIGYDRRPLIARLIDEQPDTARIIRENDELVGFRLDRPGRNAAQIGPLLATMESAGGALLQDALNQHAGAEVFIDAPLVNTAAVQTLNQSGLTPQRELTRMTRGHQLIEDVKSVWASSGPEKG